MNSIQVSAIKTSVFKTKENLNHFITRHLPKKIPENSIIVITSKIVSLAEKRVVSKNSIEKVTLIKRESDYFLGEVAYGCHLTIKHGLFIPAAGIDESNSENSEYILFPIDPFKSAQNICEFLRKYFGVEKLGVIITDSHTTPLRKGVTGISLSHWGFKGLKNLIGKKDLFGRELKMTQINYADSLATAAVLLMGEADDACPLALIENAPVEFVETLEDYDYENEMKIDVTQDLYYPIYQHKINNPIN